MNWETISLQDLAGYISDELRKKGIETVLVGGACVTIYSHNKYQSYDLDFVTFHEMKPIKQALKGLGFEEKNGYFRRNHCRWIIEFVSSPVAVGREIIINFQEMEVDTGIIQMLRAEDSVKDRLASYFYWSDRQGLDQAVSICLEQSINLKEVEKWAIEEGFAVKFQDFKSELEKNRLS